MQTYPKPITRLDDVRSTYNVVAAVRDAEAARDAIETLERGGIDGSEIALLGSLPGDADPAPMDRGVARVGGLFILGLFLGGVAGWLIGWLSGVGGSAATVLWTIFGALVGAFVVSVASFGESRAWWRTFSARDAGTLAVGVHTAEAGHADLAARLLASVEPMSVNRF